MGLRLVLYRGADGVLRCLRDRCPHRGAALSRGRVRGDEIECPYHGFRFDGSGQCTAMPCEGAGARIPRGLEVERFFVREDCGLVWLWWGAPPEDGDVDALPPVPWFPEVARNSRNAYGSAWESWPTHYVRAIESNFDLHHGPFVHGNLFPGASRATRVDPIEAVVDGEHIDLRGTLRPDDGQTGRAFDFRVQFLMPSLTLLYLTDNIYAVIADCPIDDTHCWRYARYHYEGSRVPGLGKLVSWLAVLLEWRYVQRRQDLPVVETMTPKVPTEGCDKLVRADVGTARYLRLRRRLLRQETQDLDALPSYVVDALPDEFKPRRSLPVLGQTG